jgi:hypothetical protein
VAWNRVADLASRLARLALTRLCDAYGWRPRKPDPEDEHNRRKSDEPYNYADEQAGNGVRWLLRQGQPCYVGIGDRRGGQLPGIQFPHIRGSADDQRVGMPDGIVILAVVFDADK